MSLKESMEKLDAAFDKIEPDQRQTMALVMIIMTATKQVKEGQITMDEFNDHLPKVVDVIRLSAMTEILGKIVEQSELEDPDMSTLTDNVIGAAVAVADRHDVALSTVAASTVKLAQSAFNSMSPEDQKFANPIMEEIKSRQHQTFHSVSPSFKI